MQTDAPNEPRLLTRPETPCPRSRAWVDLVKLAGPSFYVPLTTLAEHHGFVTRDYRLIVIGVLTLVVSWVVARAFERFGASRLTSVNSVAIVLAALALGRNPAAALPGNELGALILLVIFLAAFLGLRRPRLVNFVVTWLVLALWLWIASSFVQALTQDEPSLIGADYPEVDATLDDVEGDVVILILDEYPNADFLASHLADETGRRVSSLEADGFQVHGSLPVSYAFTELSLPAFFMLDLPARESDTLSEATRSDLLAVLGGDNPVVRAFGEAGYRTTIIESGWSGLRCMAAIDRCVVRSWYDEVTASVLGRSLAGSLVDNTLGSPFTHGTERVMRWIDSELPTIAGDDHDDLVVVHIMLPHTPMAFSEDCERLTEELDLDIAALIDQVRCANRIIDRVSATTEEGLITLIMGDHGTKLLGQTELPPDQWTDSMVAERMRTLVAVRGLDECREPAPRSSANLSIRLMRCLGADVPYVRDVSYATSVRGEPLVNLYPP